jgi:hypothetical protein
VGTQCIANAICVSDKPIGIASYELTRSLPTTLQSALPSIESLEAELSQFTATETDPQS